MKKETKKPKNKARIYYNGKDKLTEIQLDGVSRCEKTLEKYKGVYLYDVTGFGKSNQAMELACRMTKPNEKILFICPAGTIPQVKDYWKSFDTEKRILICEGYTGVINPHVFKSLMQGDYDFAIVDEAHRVKGLMGKTDALNFYQLETFSIAHAKAKKYVLQAYATFALLTRCKKFLFMSATPIVNSLSDLYPFLRMVKHPLVYDGYYAYLDRWSKKKIKTPFGTKWEGLKNPEAFALALSDVAFGRQHKDETNPDLKVPEPESFHEEIPLPDELVLGDKYIENKIAEMGLDIATMKPRELSRILSEVPGFETLARFREAQGFAKVPFGVSYIKRLYKDKRCAGKIIVWCYHKEVVRKVAEELKKLKIPTICITGEIPSSKRVALVKHANELEKCVVVATTALSESYNMNAFYDAVWLEYDWTKKTQDQQKGRILRKGMKKQSRFHFLTFNSGVESRLWEIITSKTEMIKGALEL